MSLNSILASVGDFVLKFMSENWSLVASVAVSYLTIKFLKASLHIALLIIFIGITVSLLTHLGYIPEFNEFIMEVTTLVRL